MSSHRDRLKFEAQLREAIAAALHQVRAHDLPEQCTLLGLADGTGDEAFRSKRLYVTSRLKQHTETTLLELAHRVLQNFDSDALTDLVSEHELPDTLRISEMTRRSVLNSFDAVDELLGSQGQAGAAERLDILAPAWDGRGPSGTFLKTLRNEFDQHYIRNADWAHSEMLEHCGALKCAQHRFVSLIEMVLRPEARTGDEQTTLAARIDEILKPDGYSVQRSGFISGHPVFEVIRRQSGVSGTPKNLIFASTGYKPEIVLTDFVNNDVQITKHGELCLIYDRPISSSAGLSWLDLVEWWNDRESIDDVAAARSQLGQRLMASLPSSSPGEYAIFSTYFKEFSARLGNSLPALLTQVYLHYDPQTARERRQDAVFVRQRMDFLLLLSGGARVVIEVDGQHHYAVDGQASPALYAEMIAEDRMLGLRGYDVYRFGGSEFGDTRQGQTGWQVGPRSHQLVKQFFERLFLRHDVRSRG